MKVKYCLINRTTRSTDYGIGVYSALVSDLVRSSNDLDLVVLDLHRNCDIRRTETVDGVKHIHIGLDTECFDAESQAMLTSILSGHNIIFHFNHLIVDQWEPVLKKMFPTSVTICTVHFLSWYFSLMGNKILFRKVIETEGDETLHPNSQYTYKYYLKNRNNFKCCDYVIALCCETGDMLHELYGVDENKIVVMPNGIKSPEHPVERNFSDTKFDIIYVGRIDEIKGVSYLARAFRHIKAKYPHANLHLIGDAEDEGYLRQCLKACPDIIYHGKVSHKELDYYYRYSDIGVLPSFHEQCSYSLLEMMSYGLPVIGTTVTGTNEMLELTPDSKVPLDLAYIDELLFIERLTSAIERYICNPEIMKKDSVLLRSAFNKKYTIEIFNKRMSEFINTYLQNAFR